MDKNFLYLKRITIKHSNLPLILGIMSLIKLMMRVDAAILIFSDLKMSLNLKDMQN